MSQPTFPQSAEAALASMPFMAVGTSAVDEPTKSSPAAASRTRLRVTLPEPAGQHEIGVTPVHLIDPARQDPWKPGQVRELMVSIWYPAQDVGGFPFAPWVTPGLASPLDGYLSGETLGIPPGRVDWAATGAHGHAGAPLDRRHGAWPVVLYSPGLQGSRALYTVLLQELASRGYVVVAIDHTYEAFAVEFPGGRVVNGEEPPPPGDIPAVTTFFTTAINARVDDTRFVLDWLSALRAGRHAGVEQLGLVEGMGGGVLDLSKVGMFGHSYGGFAAGEAMFHDERIKAGIDMDGSMIRGFDMTQPLFGEVVENGLDRPFMLMGSQIDQQGNVNDHNHLNSRDPSWVEFWRNQRGWKLDLTLINSGHYSYSDIQAFYRQIDGPLSIPPSTVERGIGAIVADRAIAAEAAYIEAFFDQHLRGQPSKLLEGPSPRFPEIRFVP